MIRLTVNIRWTPTAVLTLFRGDALTGTEAGGGERVAVNGRVPGGSSQQDAHGQSEPTTRQEKNFLLRFPEENTWHYILTIR